jgi:hypothetical protein
MRGCGRRRCCCECAKGKEEEDEYVMEGFKYSPDA